MIFNKKCRHTTAVEHAVLHDTIDDDNKHIFRVAITSDLGAFSPGEKEVKELPKLSVQEFQNTIGELFHV